MAAREGGRERERVGEGEREREMGKVLYSSGLECDGFEGFIL